MIAALVSRRAGAGLVVAGSLFALGWLLLGDSDEEKVLARLRELAHAVETGPNENAAFRALRLKKVFEEALEPNVALRAPEFPGTNGLEEITALAASAPRVYGTLSIGIGEADVRIDEATGEAKVVAAVTLSGTRGGELRRDTRRVRFTLKKTSGDFRVDYIEVEPRTDEEPEARP